MLVLRIQGPHLNGQNGCLWHPNHRTREVGMGQPYFLGEFLDVHHTVRHLRELTELKYAHIPNELNAANLAQELLTSVGGLVQLLYALLCCFFDACHG